MKDVVRTPNESKTRQQLQWVAGLGLVALFLVFASIHRDDSQADQDLPKKRRLHPGEPRIKIFSVEVDHPVARKLRRDLAGDASSSMLEHYSMTLEQQREFIQANPSCGGEPAAALSRFEEFVSTDNQHWAHELWKYCALLVHGGAYVDSSSPMLVSIESLLEKKRNVAVINDSSFPSCIHGSFLYLQSPHSNIAKGMLEVLTTTPIQTLQQSPLLLPRTLYSLIKHDLSGENIQSGATTENGWYFLEQQCSIDPTRYMSNQEEKLLSHADRRLTYVCPSESWYCCHVYDTTEHAVVLMTQHPLLPIHTLPSYKDLPKPYNTKSESYEKSDVPFISTVRERILNRPDPMPSTPNFFEVLLQNDCLPSDQKCSSCLMSKKGASCKTCAEVCSCYCKTLCHVKLEPKFIAKEIYVQPPAYSRDPSRLVPRIIHQTWFEPVSKEKYPNMSRLIESFRQSGWEYRFYTDEVAGKFLSAHFPPEVKEAYDALRPGAFKADLFRYCVLLIHGGVYADMDVMLESNLDKAVGPDVGFMVPADEPGTPVNLRMCLWNGFIAAAPGHLFLAKVVETVVNNIRNRFTSVDYDHMFCPDPELSILHAFDTLFTAGPCILGATLNQVLGRPGQTQFEAGELTPHQQTTTSGIQGRTIILHQNKWDMGAHRFTLLEKNMVVAGTDFPDYDDRENDGNVQHYSTTHVKSGIYGLERLYADKKRANEELRFFIGEPPAEMTIAAS